MYSSIRKVLVRSCVLLLLLNFIFSCTKDKVEIENPNEFFAFAQDGYNPRFAHLQGTEANIIQPSFAELSALKEDLSHEEQRLSFLDNWIRKYGEPFWDYATKDNSLNSAAYQITIPFIKKGQVQALLVANVDSRINYRLFARDDIQRFALMTPEVFDQNSHWLIAAAKLVHYDLHIYGYNQRTLATWVAKNTVRNTITSTDPKCDAIEVCFSYIDWDDPAIVWTCVELITCGNTSGGGDGDGPPGTSWPESEDPNGGGGNGAGESDENDPDFDICGGPCFDCDFSFLLSTIFPDNCDPGPWSNPLPGCSLLGQIDHPGNGCGLEAFVRKSNNNQACQVSTIINDLSSASVVTTTNQCYIQYVFRAQVVANEDCFIVGEREGGIGLGIEGAELDYTNNVTVNLPRLQLYDIYEAGSITIDSQFRCYHDCGCY